MRAARKLHDHAPPLIGKLFDQLNARPIFGDVVGDDAFTQRRLAEGGHVDAGELENGAQQDRARQDGVRAARVDPGQLGPLGRRECKQLSLDVTERPKRENLGPTVELPTHIARGQARERERRPRGERDEVEAHRFDASDGGLEGAADTIGQRCGFARRRWVGALPFVPQPKHAELERDGEIALARVGEDELGRSSSDVEEGDATPGEVERASRPEVNEVGFFLAADDAHLDTELVAHRAHEFAAILSLADGAGRNGQKCIGPMPVGNALEGPQRIETAIEDIRGDDAAAQCLAQAHELLGAVENIDAPVRIHVGDDEMKGVRSDVERSYSHVVGRDGPQGPGQIPGPWYRRRYRKTVATAWTRSVETMAAVISYLPCPLRRAALLVRVALWQSRQGRQRSHGQGARARAGTGRRTGAEPDQGRTATVARFPCYRGANRTRFLAGCSRRNRGRIRGIG
jgi:hypothetical protein